MTDISDTVARLEAESDIRRMLAFYTDAVNHRDPARAATVYAEDASLRSQGMEFHTRADIAPRLASMFDLYSVIHQVAHSSLIEVNGDTANSRTSLYEIGITVGTQELTLFLGEMEDEWVRLAEGWRFKRRTLHMTGRSKFELTKLQTVAGVPPLGLLFNL